MSPADRMSRRWARRPRIWAVLVPAIVGLVVLAGCGTIPDNSSPQPIRPFQRDKPSAVVLAPQDDMNPESLVRTFLKSTADPAAGHQVARGFLTDAADELWDDSGDMVIVDEVNVFVDERDEDSVRLRLIGDNVGTLRPDGQLLPATGRVETTMSLVRVGAQWRIDGAIPQGTMIDRSQFDATYRSATLYFPNRAATRLVPDPRWMYQGLAADPSALVNRLIDGPAADLSAAVGRGLPPGTALRGPVTPLDDGGVRVDLTGAGVATDRERTTIAAQIVWTLDGVSVGGPYIITNDGAPLVEQRAEGWQPADVAGYDPNTAPSTDVGLNIIRDGALLKITDVAAVPVGGPAGAGTDVRAAAIAANGSRVAVVSRRGNAPTSELLTGDYGGELAPITTGTSITRPSMGADGLTMWAVVDGRPTQWTRVADGTVEVASQVDVAEVAALVRAPITELQVAPDGVHAALIVGGQVVFAVLSANEDGRVGLTSPRIAAYNIGNRAVAIDWASPTMLMIARETADGPVAQLSIDGKPAVGLLSGNLSPPVRSVVANPTTVYVGDARGVLRLGSTNGQPDQYWTEVESAMAPGAIPVLP